jgi:hypothetical protein
MTFDNGPCAVIRGVPRPVALQLEQNLDRWFGSASFRGKETLATRAEWCGALDRAPRTHSRLGQLPRPKASKPCRRSQCGPRTRRDAHGMPADESLTELAGRVSRSVSDWFQKAGWERAADLPATLHQLVAHRLQAARGVR